MKITLNLDSLDACRTNTSRALHNDGHYDFNLLAEISGAKIDVTLKDLDFCAQNKDDENAILSIKRLATSLLSAYEFQKNSYKNKI